MKFRRKPIFLTCLLVLCVLLELCVPAAAAVKPATESEPIQTEPAPNDEAALAVAYGLVPEELQSDYGKTITYREFCVMLGRIIAATGEKAYISAWNTAAAKALASDKAVTRELAILSVYEAACAVGQGKHAHSGWRSLNEQMGSDIWLYLTGDYSEWANCEEISPFEDTSRDTDYMTAAIHFAAGQTSFSSGKPVFAFDLNDLRGYIQAPVTRAEAMTIAARFYESLIERTADAATVSAIMTAADARREAILNSKSDVSYTGTAYYVSSSSGSDGNDGRSPERPWKTLERVNGAPLRSGDAVFFKRGDIWREAMVWCREGVTYSAYGEGAKPRFYGASEDGVGAEKWTLYYEKGSVKIWKFYHAMQDVGGVIFNGGESWAERVYGWWVVGRGLMRYGDTKKPFVPEECLTADMTCASVIDYSGLRYPIQVWGLEERKGAFYLRCDAGNPGELFTEVEFEVSDARTGGYTGIFEAVSNCTFDNLCIMYFGDAAIHTAPNDPNITVQNCEVGWGGNSIHEYMQADPTLDYMISGDGIYGIGDGGTVSNNYCHDVDGGGITFETSDDLPVTIFNGNCMIKGNLVERCGQGIWLHDPGMRITSVKKLLIEDNMILYTGEGYVHGCFCPLKGIWIEDGLVSHAEEVRITGNTVYRAVDMLVDVEAGAILKNNQFFQGPVSVQTPASQTEGYAAVSNWAKEQVDKANSSGLVPDGLGNDYRVNITRAQFAAVAVKLYEAMSGQAAPAPGKSPFTDTNNAAVIQAEALGIVGGVGDGKFAPGSPVTREQAATMLSRVYTKLGGEIPTVSATKFTDDDAVSDYAKDAVAFMSSKEIVGGVGNNRYDPKGNASIEQALVIALRMFEKLK